ncbi:MAG: hypothetical protein L0219_16940 [Phycisphaerales bacterium]|nr:hypothetical protein [Phycisphaerales bacterium]
MTKNDLNPEEELLKLIDKVCRMRDKLDQWRRQHHDMIHSSRFAGQRAKFSAKLTLLNRIIGDLDFIIARNRRNLCRWHRGEPALAPGPGCQNCGRLLATRNCTGCNKMFLDWGCKSSDDVVAAPSSTSSGDLYCLECAARIDCEEELRGQES